MLSCFSFIYALNCDLFPLYHVFAAIYESSFHIVAIISISLSSLIQAANIILFIRIFVETKREEKKKT